MDTSETYIRMCEKAEEIQPELEDGGVGGTFIGNSILYHIAPTNQPHDRDGYYHITDEEAIRECETCGHEEPYIYKTTAIWLPRQDQLQEMLAVEGVPIISVAWVGYLLYLLQYNIGLKCSSMEQLWLAFVMKEKHNKIWDGQDWVNGH